MKLYNLQNQFIKKTNKFPSNFTGIVEWADGQKEWCVDGKFHRLDGPAWECSDGSKAWFVDGKRHRLDGPAYEGSDGSKEWYVDGKKIHCSRNEQFNLLVDIMKLKVLI